MPKFAPLSAGFMITAMLGFFLTIVFVYPVSASWGFAFALIFVLMFVASFISMGNTPVNDEEYYRELAVHNMAVRKDLEFEKKNKQYLAKDSRVQKSGVSKVSKKNTSKPQKFVKKRKSIRK